MITARWLRVLLAVGAAASVSGVAAAQVEGPRAVILEIDGVVDPFVASYVRGGIESAEEDGAAVAVLTIDTPGGLDSAMRDIVQAVLNSEVPVLCLVAPEGARAASAGAFVLIGCPVAAMAPGTNVGAAHPVGISGAIELEKAENDAAAYIRSLAERWDRNADWAEDAVRESVSISAEEAVDIDVADLIAPTIGDLLREVDGRTVEIGGGDEVTLQTSGMVIEERGMGIGVSLLHTLLDPTFAFLFFWLGIAMVVLEFFVPGGVLGIVGGLLLILAVIALGMLPVEILGIVLLIASVAFFVLELKLPGTAIGTGLGLASLVLGGLFLFDRSVPGVAVSPWVIVPVGMMASLFSLVVLRAAVRMRRQRSVAGVATVLGAEGVALTDLTPNGIVQAASEEWTAESLAGPLTKGTRVLVIEVEGLRVKVTPVVERTEPGPALVPGEREGGS